MGKRQNHGNHSSQQDHNKKRHQSHQASQHQHHQNSPQQQRGKRPSFASYLDNPDLPPKVKVVCEIIATSHSLVVEKVLDEAAIRVTQEDVEEVLKLSYGFPGTAVKFFRWSGYQLNDKHSPYAWNLVVDLLGKNCLFDAMWDAIKSMKKERLLSLATFASVFSSYVIADRVHEAIMTFEVMDQYGCQRDVVVLNSLLSAICRDGKTLNAVDFLRIAKDKIRPDADTYAILLEGLENDGNVGGARQIFAEMVIEIGWDPGNVPAYNSFLGTLLKGPDGMHEAIRYFETMRDRRCYPGLKFFKTALEECVRNSDVRAAVSLWETGVRTLGFRPDTQMYNAMIALHCNSTDIDVAKRMLDDMICDGAFPDSQTYNVIFQFLIRSKKLKEAYTIFTEMTKNECFPSQANCSVAIRIYIEAKEPNMATQIWKCMVENYNSELEETGNLLIIGLRDLDRLPEAVKYAENMIDRGIKLNSATLSKLKQSLAQLRKDVVYDELLRKWKTCKVGRNF